MPFPNTITASTNAALHQAATAYAEAVTIPCFVAGVDGFAATYLGIAEDGLKTLVTGNGERLAITIDSQDGTTRAFVNVDLTLDGVKTASIVEPGLQDKRGNPDLKNGQFTRRILRPLTEPEGQELAMDLYSLIAKIPEDRKKQKDS